MGVPRSLQREVARPAGVNRYDLVAPADRSCRIGRQDSSFCGDRAPRAGARPVAARRLRYAIVWPVRPLLRNSSLQRSGPPQLSSHGDARRGGIPIALHRCVQDDAAVPVIGRPLAAADADRGGTATHCPYCALQCGMRLGPALSVTGDPGFPVNKGQLCIKGFTAAGALGHRERLTTPLVRGASGELEPATWEEALGRVASNLQRTRARFGAGAVGVFGSAALANGLLRVLVRERLFDAAFIEERTEGFARVRASLAGYWPDLVERITGVPEAQLVQAARMLGCARSPMVLTGRGPEQQAQGVGNTLAFINIALALGKKGRPFTGYGCLTGQGNGQGGREHGQKADQLPGYRRIDDPAARAHVASVWGVDPDELHGPGVSATELLSGPDGPTAMLVFVSKPVRSG